MGGGEERNRVKIRRRRRKRRRRIRKEVEKEKKGENERKASHSRELLIQQVTEGLSVCVWIPSFGSDGWEETLGEGELL